MKKLLTIVLILSCSFTYGQAFDFYTKGAFYKNMRVYDSIGVRNLINTKVNILDSSTASVSNWVTQYQRKKTSDSILASLVQYSFTNLANNDQLRYNSSTSQWNNFVPTTITSGVDSIWRVLGKDSILYSISGRQRSVKDSIGGGSSGWALTGNAGITAVINFSGTTDSKSYRIRTNNIERAIFDSVGNVGINTTAPSAKLHILDANRAGNGDATLKIGPSGTGKVLEFLYNNTGNYGVIESMDVGVAVENITINPLGGNIGIGTTTFTDRLNVNGAINGTQLKIGSVGSSVVSGSIISNGNADFVGSSIETFVGLHGTFLGITGSLMGTYTNSDFAIVTNNAMRLAIKNSGQVGIGGITSPTAALNIKAINNSGAVSTAPMKFQYGGAPIATTAAANSSAGVGVITYATQASAPFSVNDLIVISGVTPTGFNGVYTVISCSTTQVFFGSSSTTGPQTVAGTVRLVALITTAEAGTQEFNGAFYQTKGSGLRYGIGGVIQDFISDANNTSTTETDLYSYTTPANTLQVDSSKLTATYGGTFNDVTATGQLQVYFGGTVIGNTGTLTVSAIGGWKIDVFIIRTSATTARSIVNMSTPGASTAIYTSETDLTGLTFTGTNILKITGTAGGATGGNSDITAKLGTVSWMPPTNN